MSDIFDYMNESLKDDSFDCHLEFIANVLNNGNCVDIVYTAELFGAIDLLNQMNLDDLDHNDFELVKSRMETIREILRFMMEGIMDEKWKQQTIEYLNHYRETVA